MFCRIFAKKTLPVNIGFKKLQFLTQHSHAISYNRVIGFRYLESCLLLSQPKTTVKEKVICVRGGVVKFWIVWNKMNISPALMKDVLCLVTSMGLRNQTSNHAGFHALMLYCWGLRMFSLSHTHDKMNNIFLCFFTKLKIYHLSYFYLQTLLYWHCWS